MKPATLTSLAARDRRHVWHPLTQHKTHPDTLGITRASGALLFDEEGRSYIDGIASWYTAIHGHCHPFILEKVSEQMKILDQVVFSGFTHEPAVALAEELIGLLPFGQEKVFYSDNGSTAVEVALKMALQFHANKGEDRSVLLAFEEGFHGDTFGAMSVSNLSVYNGAFERFFLDVERIPVPASENPAQLLTQVEERLARGDVAAFIYEPLVQGAGGMKMHDPTGLDRLLALMKVHKVITIADEVMTGFGKTGAYFASDHLQTKPDIVCLSKALTAGLLPMGATTCTREIYQAFYSDQLSKGLFHGHTYTANPLACAAARAGIHLLRQEETWEGIRRIEEAHQRFEIRVKDLPVVGETRQCGVIFALDLASPMDRYGRSRDQLFAHFMAKGVYLRPLGNTIYILPPYCITPAQLQQVYDSIMDVLQNLPKP